MLGIDRRVVQNFDWFFLGLVGLLVVFGIVNLISATHSASGELLSGIVRRQLIALAAGGLLLVLVLLIDYRHFERYAYLLYAATVVLLLVTLALAPVTRGTQAWLFEGRVQPSELAKVGLVLALARYFHRNPPGSITRLRELAPPLLIAALPVGLIILQKDLGVAMLTLLVTLTFVPALRSATFVPLVVDFDRTLAFLSATYSWSSTSISMAGSGDGTTAAVWVSWSCLSRMRARASNLPFG